MWVFIKKIPWASRNGFGLRPEFFGLGFGSSQLISFLIKCLSCNTKDNKLVLSKLLTPHVHLFTFEIICLHIYIYIYFFCLNTFLIYKKYIMVLIDIFDSKMPFFARFLKHY